MNAKALTEEVASLRKLLDKAKHEKEELLTRLSRMASGKLRDNNPNITDLGDPNRPTKLAEQMSELYDNEWTDALEEILQSRPQGTPDETVIKELLNALMDVYKRCKDIAFGTDRDYFLRVQAAILSSSDKFTEHIHEVVMPDVLKAEINDFRKSYAPKLSEKVASELQKEKHSHMGEKMTKYYNKCVDLCWKAVIQDPPIVLSLCKPGVPFKKEDYREYTARGRFVEYVVWPKLQLHENGPVLCKGVAQGTNAYTEKKKADSLQETIQSLTETSEMITRPTGDTPSTSNRKPKQYTNVPRRRREKPRSKPYDKSSKPKPKSPS